jgi:hypothetical protein
MARSRTSRQRELTDNELLASAWSELKGTPRAIPPSEIHLDPHSAIQRPSARSV